MKFHNLLTALLSTQVPAAVTENCEMEPNYGSHEYFRKQHEERLQGKVRLVITVTLRRRVMLILMW